MKVQVKRSTPKVPQTMYAVDPPMRDRVYVKKSFPGAFM